MCNLTELLNRLQKGHSEDVYLCTSGRLNPSKLSRPPEAIPCHWPNADRPRGDPVRGVGKPSDPTTGHMKDALAYFTLNTALGPNEAQHTPLFRYLNPAARGPHASEEGLIRSEALRSEGSPEGRRGEAPRLPERKVLRDRAAASSRRCDEVHDGSSYWGGVTKADKYRKFLRFQKEVLAKQDLLKSDLTGRAAAVCREGKLEQVRRLAAQARGHAAAAPR